MARQRTSNTICLLAPLLLLTIPGCVTSQDRPVTPAVAQTATGSQADAAPRSSALERRVRYETAELALATGNKLIGLMLFEELISESGDSPEGHFYAAAAASVAGGLAQSESLAKQALVELEASDQAPWYFGELTRLTARAELARRGVAARRGLDDILARHHEARGGLGKLKGVQSMIVTGLLEVGESSTEFRVYRLRPGFYRFEMATGQGVVVEATDGRVAWRRDPAVEEGRVKFLGRVEGARLRRGAPFDDVLLRAAAADTEILLAGRTTRDDREVYRLEVLVADQRQTIYLDTNTFLEIKRELYGDDGEVSIEVRTEYAEQDGLLFPSVLTVTSAQGLNRYRFTAYDFETPVDRWWFDAESLQKAKQ